MVDGLKFRYAANILRLVGRGSFSCGAADFFIGMSGNSKPIGRVLDKE
jgi:hypothetical protein